MEKGPSFDGPHIMKKNIIKFCYIYFKSTKVGQGLGKNALGSFVQRIFEDKNIDSITLTVFDSNIIAKEPV